MEQRILAKNLQSSLYVITKNTTPKADDKGECKRNIYHVDVSKDAQEKLANIFEGQCDKFLPSDVTKHTYDGRYKVDHGEVLTIASFELASRIDSVNSAFDCPGTFVAFDSKAFEAKDEKLAAICWVKRLFNDDVVAMFQAINSSHLISSKRTKMMIWCENVLSPMENEGLAIGSGLAAVWRDGELLFKSYHLADRMFGLSSHNYSATTDQVKEVLGSSVFATCDDIDKYIQKHVDSRVRRIVVRLFRNNVMDLITPAIVDEFFKHESLAIDVNGDDKIILPEDKSALKHLLGVLDDRVYRSVFNQDELMYSNSSRKIE